MRKGLEPWVKSCEFVEDFSTSRVSVLPLMAALTSLTVGLSSSLGSIGLSTMVLRS